MLSWLLFLVLVIAIGVLLRWQQVKKERANAQKLLATWESLGPVIGREKAEILAVFGVPTCSGMMDFGEEVYQWRAHPVCIELWFKDQICFRDPQRE